MIDYFDYTKIFIDDNDEQEYSGVCFDMIDFSAYEEYYIKYIVDHQETYRPDLIAFNLWGNIDLAWVLNEINNAPTLKYYTYEKEIYYLAEEILVSLGIK